MTATFMLQFIIGAATGVGHNTIGDVFGLVAMVAMVPLISIQVVGLIYERKAKRAAEVEYADDEIIELWEVGQ